MAKAAQRLFFKLADAFAAQPELVGDFLQSVRLAATQPKAQTQNVTLPGGKFAEDFFNRFTNDRGSAGRNASSDSSAARRPSRPSETVVVVMVLFRKRNCSPGRFPRENAA